MRIPMFKSSASLVLIPLLRDVYANSFHLVGRVSIPILAGSCLAPPRLAFSHGKSASSGFVDFLQIGLLTQRGIDESAVPAARDGA